MTTRGHQPSRMCAGCRRVRPRLELVRLVCVAGAGVKLDSDLRLPGRGAYLCARLSCWENAIKQRRFEHEFELTISDEDRVGLDAFIATLPRD